MFNAVEYEHMRENLLSKKNLIVTIPKRVRKADADARGVTLLCEGRHYRKDLLDPIFTQDDLALLPAGGTEDVTVRLEWWSPAILRVRMGRGKKLPPRDKEMVCGAPAATEFFMEEDEKELRLSTETLRLRVTKDDFSLEIRNAAGEPVFSQYDRDEHSISNIVKSQNEKYRDSYSGFESYPFALMYDEDSGREFWTDAVRIDYDEHFYGFGEKFGPLDKLGQETVLWQVDALSGSTEKSYKNVPFFLSTKGYGVYVNSSAKSRYQMGSYHYKACQMVCHEGAADYFIIYGPSMKEILPRYTDITGKTPDLPEWSYGLWMSKNTYRTREELLSVARMVREKRIPCDVVHLDVGWFEEDWMCDFEFSQTRFPDPKGMTDELRNMGFRLSMWQLPYIKKENKLYQEAAEKGYFAKTTEGKVSTPEADGVIDMSNPVAVAWYRGLLGNLFDQGLAVVKVDFGESSEEDAVYHKYEGWEMHNLYPLLYNRAAFEKTVEATGEGIIWARSAFAGSQRYPLHWGGDTNTDFEGMYHSLRGGLSFGLSGFPFWSHDVGGYYCDVDPEVYVRWVQMGMFSSHTRMHGTTSREPWVFGPEIESIFLKYARLRYRLLPYILSQARLCAAESLPMLRAMVLEFQNDPTTYDIDDQYMFGGSFLVAPVVSFRHSRKVYLPAGCGWYDYWTKERFEGGQWTDYQAPLDVLPLFVRAGSLIPYGEEMQYVGERRGKTVEVEVYPGERRMTGQALVNGVFHELAYDKNEELLDISPAADGVEWRTVIVNNEAGSNMGPE